MPRKPLISTVGTLGALLLGLSACSGLYEVTVFNPCDSTRTVVIDEVSPGEVEGRAAQRSTSAILPGSSAVVGSVSDFGGTRVLVQALESDWAEEVLVDEPITVSLPAEVCDGTLERAAVVVTTGTHSRIRIEAIGTARPDMPALITRAADDVGLDLELQRLQTGAFQFGGQDKLVGRNESLILELDRVAARLLTGGFGSVDLTICDWHGAVTVETEVTASDGVCQTFEFDDSSPTPRLAVTFDGGAFYEGEPPQLVNTAIGVIVVGGMATGVVMGIRSTIRSRRLRAAQPIDTTPSTDD